MLHVKKVANFSYKFMKILKIEKRRCSMIAIDNETTLRKRPSDTIGHRTAFKIHNITIDLQILLAPTKKETYEITAKII